MCDMTDRDPDAIKVGMPLEMTFRQLYYVGGIYNYWWKCTVEILVGVRMKEWTA